MAANRSVTRVADCDDVTANAGKVPNALLPAFALLASPAFTGTPTAPTPATADSSTKLATTAYVQAQGYITASALSPYLTTAAAAAAYSPLAGSSSIVTVGTVGTGTWAGTAIAVNHGGTGQTTAAGAFNALSPVTTLGDLIYGDAANSNARLAGNITTTRKFLRQVGGGASSAAPAWDTLLAADVPDLTATYVGIAGTQTVTGSKTFSAAVKVASGGTPFMLDGSTVTGFSGFWCGPNANSQTTSNYTFLSNGGTVTALNSATGGSTQLRCGGGWPLLVSDASSAGAPRVIVGFNPTGTAGDAGASLSSVPLNNTYRALSLQGVASQAGTLLALRQLSSTSTARDVASVDGYFVSNTDASYAAGGKLSGYYNNAGTPTAQEALRWWTSGTGGRVALSVPNSAPTDSHIGTSQVVLYLDETGNNLKFRAKYSDGTTLKTGTVAVA